MLILVTTNVKNRKSVEIQIVWRRLEQLMDEMGSACGQIYDLELVLSRKRDSATQVCYLDEICKVILAQIYKRIWKNSQFRYFGNVFRFLL